MRKHSALKMLESLAKEQAKWKSGFLMPSDIPPMIVAEPQRYSLEYGETVVTLKRDGEVFSIFPILVDG